MLTICKGEREIKVTKGAYEGIYKKMGFRLVESHKKLSTDFDYQDDSSEDVLNDDLSDELNELLETPLSEMNSKTLKKVAKMLEIEVKGLARKEVEDLVSKAIQ